MEREIGDRMGVWMNIFWNPEPLHGVKFFFFFCQGLEKDEFRLELGNLITSNSL